MATTTIPKGKTFSVDAVNNVFKSIPTATGNKVSKQKLSIAARLIKCLVWLLEL